MPDCLWKPNWKETQKHFTDWWNNEGMVALLFTPPVPSRTDIPTPPPPANLEDALTGDARAERTYTALARQAFLGDQLPIMDTAFGPGSMALLLGSKPQFTNTVWFHPAGFGEPEDWPTLRFDPENRWWKEHEKQMRRARALAGDNCMVSPPHLFANMDVLASLRDAQDLLMDMIERPEWVLEKLEEIFVAWKAAWERSQQIVALPDGSNATTLFGIWGPGRTDVLECDMSAMFSPDMFEKFVMPTLVKQCEFLDYSLYHLDGVEAFAHLDHILSIESLNAIQWQPPHYDIEGPLHPRWDALYKRILSAGKSVWIGGGTAQEVQRLLNAIGSKGIYIGLDATTEQNLKASLKLIDQLH